ncbi:adenosylmethionine--8-amino-7-oxononanoate transaminase [Marinagarivorans algicola]|uniref:adenosylmethionine--8-amino-7-oxononanoate transaminase n=1 Tax=Marinagarivorans algicola TaxID=1513270 RepID=UPI003736711D
MDNTALLAADRNTLWHPYSNTSKDNPLYAVKSASGCTLTLADDRRLIDGMASWWSTIHGYNHPTLNQAITTQLESMAHVMFGGLTHEPAIQLAQSLIRLTPEGLNRVFLADSGSVSVEVALKMARQYWLAKKQPKKQKFLAFSHAYHGDTFGAMSVCDPDNGMHALFSAQLPQQHFCAAPLPTWGNTFNPDIHLSDIKNTLKKHHHEIAAVILEPIVQGAGGMRFYSPQTLQGIKQLCVEYNVLLIADEIATGFGRTGKWFACEHADITPDILCLGKALTGGYMTLAATLCTDDIAQSISDSDCGVLMHGPTFMANPLACSVANASIALLEQNHWPQQVSAIEQQLTQALAPAKAIEGVKNVRTLGAIGVIELERPVDMQRIQPFIVDQGVWLRPFGKLLYTMPPYCINAHELATISQAMLETCQFHNSHYNSRHNKT